ncbi:MAG: 50S ribosomal protein L35 [Patescibacteria group bacterium]
MARGMKTKKALSKRVKITGRKKVMKRPPGQNHFNSKDSGNASRAKHGDKIAPNSLAKDAKVLLSQF